MSSTITAKPPPRDRRPDSASVPDWLEDAEEFPHAADVYSDPVVTALAREVLFSVADEDRFDAVTSPTRLRSVFGSAKIEASSRPPLGVEPVPTHGHAPPNRAVAPQVGTTPTSRLPLDLDRLFSLSAANNREAAIDLVLDYFDDLLIARRFPECNAALDSLNDGAVSRIAPSVLVSVLGVTLRAKPYLPSRQSFFDRVHTEVRRLKGRRYAKDLLEKYR